ncbi:hypothetical protein [Zhongshania sp. BJYM1]|uniref:hypothetical protein n=1 Tax=Zhongshania aquatica TaxID=2965069 RepID=UPI0022B30921|nr:hypothetical protein [Marortus sp. BJYM1]
MSQSNLEAEKSKDDGVLMFPESQVRRECGNRSDVTWWRWKKKKIIPSPDILIESRNYYSAGQRQLAHAAILQGGLAQ